MEQAWDQLEPHEYVDEVLRDALERGASDLFWLPSEDGYRVRVKTTGTLGELGVLPRDYGQQCVARLKVLGGLLTYRSSVAQDGTVRGVSGHPDAELRIASLPTQAGERVTLRILGQTRLALNLDQLGYQPDVLGAFHELLSLSSGMLILTGPTGSGKTTTIYAMIRQLLAWGQDPASIITIEDPVEHRVDGISQVQVTRAGDEWGYPEALRAALRHDVKTLVIGEMRDRDVVKVALDAALTGHRVITTYHAGDVPSVYARLLHQGFEPFLVAAAVTGVVSQRLLANCDGSAQIPVAAVLRSTDAWRDVIVDTKGLSGLRKEVVERPEADLPQVVQKMVEQGIIDSKELLLK